MAVTETQVAALRAQLAGDLDEHRRLLASLGEGDRLGYATLLAAAFCEAVERRFGTTPDRPAVIEFVGDMRARSDGIAEQLAARDAERMILRVLGEGAETDLRDLDDETMIGAQAVVTGSLIGDEGLDDSGLDAFIATVRSTAERLTR